MFKQWHGLKHLWVSLTPLGPMHLVFPLLGVVMPFLACVTLVSNTIIITVLSRLVAWPWPVAIPKVKSVETNFLVRPGLQSPTNCVLLSMAVCDLTTILVPTPWWERKYVFTKIYGKTARSYNFYQHEKNHCFSWIFLFCLPPPPLKLTKKIITTYKIQKTSPRWSVPISWILLSI